MLKMVLLGNITLDFLIIEVLTYRTLRSSPLNRMQFHYFDYRDFSSFQQGGLRALTFFFPML
jgi:hypothetical protein